jgi:hypothetical protein
MFSATTDDNSSLRHVPIRVNMHLPPHERQGVGTRITAAVGGLAKQCAIDALEKGRKQTLIWGVDDQYPAAFAWRKPAVVEVVPIHGHQRSSKLLGKTIVFGIGGASQFVFFQDEQDIPVETLAHVRDEAGRYIGIGVDPGPGGESLGVRCQFGGEGAHS